MIVLLLLALSFIQEGIGKYKTVIRTIHSFQSYEQSKIQKYLNYLQYGTYGVRILFVPSPQSIFFINSSTISELTAGMDSGERLRIYNSFKGRSLFTEKTGGFKDFSGIMLLWGSFVALLLGYEAFIHKDYLRFMVGVIKPRSLFSAILFSRILIIGLFLFGTTAISLVLLKLNGISTGTLELAYLGIYLLMLILVWIFFFIIGTMAGSLRSKFSGFVLLIISWFFLIFILPSIINSFTYLKAENIEAEKNMEKVTFEMLMRVEREMRDKAGPLNEKNKSMVYQEVKKHLDKEFKVIQTLEKRMEIDMQKNIRFHQGLSMLFPSTFYLSTGNEISSKGYVNFIKFYRYIQQLKHRFVPYIMKKFFESRSRAQSKLPIQSFFKQDEDIFRAETALPSYFLAGISLIIFYIIGLTMLSYALFKKSLLL